MQVEEVHKAVAAAAERARSGDGPTLLEFRTYRYKGHSMSDPAKNRTKEEEAEYKSQDPLEQVKSTILSKKFATEKQLEDIDQKIKTQVNEAVDFAEKYPFPDPSEAFKDVYVQTDYPFIKE
jgi:pyruvate dehydrogenase E1 component alpha subunit